MNNKTIKENQRKIYNLLDKHYNYKTGVIKINTNNTFTHELSKFLVCWELAQNKQEFITEAIFTKGNKRADIVNLNNAEAIEILHTEKKESLLVKREEYPINIIALTTKQIIPLYLEKYLKKDQKTQRQKNE